MKISKEEINLQNIEEDYEPHSEVYNGIMQGLQEAVEYNLKQKEKADGK